MADHFECNNCNAHLVGLVNLNAADLGACPRCGQTDWRGIVELQGSAAGVSAGSGTLTEKGDRAEAQGVSSVDALVVAPELAQQPVTAFDPAVEAANPGVSWPTEEELAALDIQGDFVVVALLLHAPGVADDPDSPVIVELMIEGQWSRPYTIGPVPETVLEAAIQIADYWERWWPMVQERRGTDP
jgi:hypothetical protein